MSLKKKTVDKHEFNKDKIDKNEVKNHIIVCLITCVLQIFNKNNNYKKIKLILILYVYSSPIIVLNC